ncbi:phosphotransferase enzyme family protein [Streptomyces sp. NPDC048603]|uniref:phosphotransferase enzyme family protein n=1 Tax=Streptomyces sp. NPDC048603 TaxID=3365577 RepID=UPI00371EB983
MTADQAQPDSPYDPLPLLAGAYGLTPSAVETGPAGTATVNRIVTDRGGRRWFVKCYHPGTNLRAEQQALELGRFAGRAGVPVPEVRHAAGRLLIARSPGSGSRGPARRTGAGNGTGGWAVSVSAYVEDAETAVGGLHGGRWEAVGRTLARLHTALAGHPAGPPRTAPPSVVFDPEHRRNRLRRLVARYEERPREGFEAWALEAARERLAQLPRVEELAAGLPDRLTVQTVHGDLASPNLLLRDERVAAVIDFRPPAPRAVLWEIARIGCDPRTVVLREDWPSGLARLVAAYRAARPGFPPAELAAVPRAALCVLAGAVYPLTQPLERPEAVTRSLRAYALDRDRAAGILRERLPEAERAVRETLFGR